jgi:hypothetical protein
VFLLPSILLDLTVSLDPEDVRCSRSAHRSDALRINWFEGDNVSQNCQVKESIRCNEVKAVVMDMILNQKSDLVKYRNNVDEYAHKSHEESRSKQFISCQALGWT